MAACADVETIALQLRRMGFAEEDMRAALLQGGPLPSMSGALDWLCLHVPHERLPKRFAAGAPFTAGHLIRQAYWVPH